MRMSSVSKRWTSSLRLTGCCGSDDAAGADATGWRSAAWLAWPRRATFNTRVGMSSAVEARENAFTLRTVVAGQLGRGRVVLDGTIAYASSRTKAGKALAAELGKEGDFEHAAFGPSRDLLLNGVRWLCGR